MNLKYYFIACSILFICFACQNTTQQSNQMNDDFQELSTPSQNGGEPNLFVSETGLIYLSWVEYLNDTTDALVYATLENNRWSAPRTIASGSNWFVNWADFPSLVAYEDGGQTLAAHWLQKSARGTYDYDVRIAQSTDAGQTWNPSFVPHQDGIAAEHGFVSLLPLSDQRIFATWLDGRNTKNESTHAAMTLRAAVFNRSGQLSEEKELDHKICDCCQTSAAKTEEGIIVAYRDRSDEEIRDISVVRQVNGIWTEPQTVYPDTWQIAGCPVNGPSVATRGAQVAIAWFSMPENKAQVKVAFSNDNGAHFSEPQRLDLGEPLGRVDLLWLNDKEVLVSWMEKEGEDEASILARSVQTDGFAKAPFTIAKTTAARKSGFPVMAKNDTQLVFAWTQVDSLTRIKTLISNYK